MNTQFNQFKNNYLYSNFINNYDTKSKTQIEEEKFIKGKALSRMSINYLVNNNFQNENSQNNEKIKNNYSYSNNNINNNSYQIINNNYNYNSNIQNQCLTQNDNGSQINNFTNSNINQYSKIINENNQLHIVNYEYYSTNNNSLYINPITIQQYVNSASKLNPDINNNSLNDNKYIPKKYNSEEIKRSISSTMRPKNINIDKQIEQDKNDKKNMSTIINIHSSNFLNSQIFLQDKDKENDINNINKFLEDIN